MDLKALRKHEDCILLRLAAFYYEAGHKEPALNDPDTGGVFEHKLARWLDYKLVPPDDSAPPEFIAACRMLEQQGYVKRLQRAPEVPHKGIWPTQKGLERAAYLKSSWYSKGVQALQQQENWSRILVSIVTAAITAVLTMLAAGLLGWFGLRLR